VFVDEVESIKKELADAKTQMDSTYAVHRNEYESLWYEIERIYLEPNGVRQESYHGDNLIGPACRDIMANCNVICDGIEAYVLGKLEHKGIVVDILNQQIQFQIQIYKTCFQCFDGLFVCLRRKSDDFESLEARSDIAKSFLDASMTCWRLLKMSVTPKLHILEDHMVDMMIFLKKVELFNEEFIEQSHQIGKKCNLLIKIRDICKKFKAMSELEHARHAHNLDAIQLRVKNERKRNMAPKPDEEKAIYKKRILQQQSREEGLHEFVEEEEINDDILMSSDELNVMFVRTMEEDEGNLDNE